MKFSVDAAVQHIRRHHPKCPDFAAKYIAQAISDRQWEGISLGRAVGITMQGILRHRMTDYDAPLLAGMDREEARRRVQPRVQALLAAWTGPQDGASVEN